MSNKKDYKLTDISVIKKVMGDNGVTFSKALGQNFLINPTVCPRMAESLGANGGKTGVLEIGAGVGVLTKELLERYDKVVCVELDNRLFPVLRDTLSGYDNLTLVSGDILKIDLKQLLFEHFADADEIFVCANLPYYITSPVIMRLLEEKLPFKKIVVMVQKEAGDRLCAEVGTRESGAVTVAVNYYARAQKLFDVSRGSFMPSPKVDSCVIELDLTEKGDWRTEDEKLFFRMVKSAFAQRRKTILNSLSNGMGIGKDKISKAAEAAGLSVTARAEALTMEQLVNLSNEIYKTTKE